MLDEPAQHAVIRGLQAGDRDAWAKLYDNYSLDVWRYVARLLGPDAATVADVVQETFLEAAGSAGRFDPQRGTLWSWLTGIAHHKLAACWRQAARAARVKTLAEAQAISLHRRLNDGQPFPLAEQRELADLVRAALAELTPEYAALLTAKYLDEHSLSQMAGQWGNTVEAIKSKLARARAEFRTQFEMYFPDDRPTPKKATANQQPTQASEVEQSRDTP
ncbi:MAG TPA: sigma-70 family RNA polymerase sigma factor [Pirellulales bacterium]|nr:sigma-70 family RNA polymerase sigma factor [Pirellulales bacterium]